MAAWPHLYEDTTLCRVCVISIINQWRDDDDYYYTTAWYCGMHYHQKRFPPPLPPPRLPPPHVRLAENQPKKMKLVHRQESTGMSLSREKSADQGEACPCAAACFSRQRQEARVGVWWRCGGCGGYVGRLCGATETALSQEVRFFFFFFWRRRFVVRFFCVVCGLACLISESFQRAGTVAGRSGVTDCGTRRHGCS